MPLTSGDKKKITEIVEATVGPTAEKVEESIRITRYFTIIVAASLVATFITVLMGLGGLYFSFRNESGNVLRLENKIKEMESEIQNYMIEKEILKVKYPYIKF